MLIRKTFEEGETDGVTYGNGQLAIGGVRLNVYSYAEDGVLIDTGAHALRESFLPFMKRQNPEQVRITHCHEDHTGCAAPLIQATGVPVYMDELYAEETRKRADYPLYRKLFWGKRPPFEARPMPESFASRRGTWQVIPTPGHAKDHVSFLNTATGHLFTGDVYTQGRTKVVLKDENMPQLIESLTLLLTYDFKRVFCSHAGPLENGREALRDKRDYLLEMQDTVRRKAEQGKSIRQIRDEVIRKRYPITLFSGGEWDSMHLIRSLLEDEAIK
ncbi:MBL fold metallo-hydrolase [Salisediminibacterium selenitireducens]|uniref:Beta-lactamase domain protein n=1 Tax=Bacillus selenitireducens (strain ATCC 700615 / DSM 15326 / MLS10) TaxID=439292 RepID=D6XZS8_BACIE|nr:MBL fold metallo-hydrolase [Salisediminibacterium selenitireducens]ADI00430.1 beta-lactamase domain protein [[Bacillus] selenitireducens MLS10]